MLKALKPTTSNIFFFFLSSYPGAEARNNNDNSATIERAIRTSKARQRLQGLPTSGHQKGRGVNLKRSGLPTMAQVKRSAQRPDDQRRLSVSVDFAQGKPPR